MSQGDPRVHWSMHAALQHVAYIEQHEDLLQIGTLCTLCNCEMCNCAICAIVKLAFWLHYEWMVTPVKIMQCCGCTYTGKGSLTLPCIFSLIFIFCTFAACALLLCYFAYFFSVSSITLQLSSDFSAVLS